jgi:hypothetical protein
MWEQILISMLPSLISMVFGDSGKNASNLAGLFGQGYQTARNYQNQQQNLDWQRNFAMQQFNYNSMLNDRSFFHSLPASQIQKYVSAGLSPDLLYGQLSSIDYGLNQSLQQPNAVAPNFAGLENANLLKDLGKKDTEIFLNLSKKAINEIDYSLKKIEESYQQLTLSNRIDLVFLEKQFKQITNELQQSNVEENVINNMKLAAALGLVRGINDEGRVVYSTTPKFDEIAEFYLSDLRQKYNIQEAEFKNLCQKWNKSFAEIAALNSDILINSVAYQQDVLNLITSAVGSGVSLKQNENGEWVVDYDGDTGDVAGIVTMGLIDSVLSAVGIKFTLGKNASKVLGKHETKSTSTVKTDNTNRNYNKEVY